MAAKSGKNWNFSPRKRILLYYPELQKFAQYRSISYRFNVLFPAKNPRWHPKVAKIEIFPSCLGYSSTTLWVKNSLEIVLSLTVFELFTLFNFPLKSKMAAKSGKNWIFPLSIGYSTNSSTTLWVKNSIEIALFLTVFKIFTLFRFPLNSKMAAKSGENWKFSPRNWILLYYPVGQKFAQNYSISYCFRDIFNVLFSAKIQDGHQKWQKLKFFPFAYDTLTLPCGSKIQSKSLLPFPRHSQFFIFR